eukprot:5316093-Prymnesium_polylepis.1
MLVMIKTRRIGDNNMITVRRVVGLCVSWGFACRGALRRGLGRRVFGVSVEASSNAGQLMPRARDVQGRKNASVVQCQVRFCGVSTT